MPVGDLTFQDNAPLLKTLEHPRDGVFALLNSECVRRDGKDENLLKQLLKKHERAPFVGERRGPLPGVFVPRVSVKSTSAERADALSVFGVSYFAADVSYRINAFVEKNRDRLPNEICALAATSGAPSSRASSRTSTTRPRRRRSRSGPSATLLPASPRAWAS